MANCFVCKVEIDPEAAAEEMTRQMERMKPEGVESATVSVVTDPKPRPANITEHGEIIEETEPGLKCPYCEDAYYAQEALDR